MKFLLIIAVFMSLISCNQTDEEKDVANGVHVARDWKVSKEGVKYFHTCIDGMLFLATPSTYQYNQLSGPVGSCDKD